MPEVISNTLLNYLSPDSLNEFGQSLIGQKRIYCPNEIYETIIEILNKPKQIKVFDVNSFMDMYKETIKVNFKTPVGKTIILDCPIKCDISEIKLLYNQKENMTSDQQRFIFAGKQLEDGRTLENYNIKNDSTIHVTLRLRGGMFHVSSGKSDLEVSKPLIQINLSFLSINSKIDIIENDTLESIRNRFISSLIKFQNKGDYIKIFTIQNPSFILKYGKNSIHIKEDEHNIWQEISKINSDYKSSDIILECC